jgi:hypothetical protein
LRPDDVGFLVKLGKVDLPPQCALGVAFTLRVNGTLGPE